MQTLALDGSNDLVLTNGRLVMLTGVADCAATKLQCRFQFFRGSWFLDTRQGVPYYQAILVKNPNFDLIAQILRSVVLDTPGIKSLDDLQFDFAISVREATANFEATADDGSTITASGVPGSFIVAEVAP